MATQVELAGHLGWAALQARVAESPPWLAERRRRAFEVYEALPMPASSRDEDWRRTDVSELRPEEFVSDPPVTDGGAGLLDELRRVRHAIAPESALVACTRRGVRVCDDTDALTAQGVIVGALADAAHRHPELVQRALDTVAEQGDPLRFGGDKFLALWNALWHDGVFVHVPAGVEARLPVVAAHSAGGDHPAILPATVALLEHDSSLTLIEVYASPASPTPLLSDAVSALVVGDHARLDHCVLQRWGLGAWHLALHRATLGRNAVLRSFLATLGAHLQKSYVEALLDGQGGDAGLAAVCFGGGEQHLDHQSLQAHRAPQTHSDLMLKVAVRDRARSVYGGLIDVAESAQQTDGYVQNRNLMLSRGARATGIPRLEIRANDVRCSHGVTAGHIDEEQRFYLQSRGVSLDDADRIIVRGFMQDTLDRCPHTGFAETVGHLLDETVAGRSLAGVAAEDDPA